jgi:hypothetical protein
MRLSPQKLQEAELRRLQRIKGTLPVPPPNFGSELVHFFKHAVEKKQRKLGVVGETWSRVVPSPLLDHCSIESFSKGTLTVLVDSASHLYDLKLLLLSGLQKQMLALCKGAGLRKITLRQGRWYDGGGQDKRPRFD